MKKILSIIAVTIFILVALVPATQSYGTSATDSYEDGNFLLDYGNGKTYWYDVIPGSTIELTLSATFLAAEIDYNKTGSEISIGGISSDTIGSSNTGGTYSVTGTSGITVLSSWHIFLWDSNTSEWEQVTDYSETYASQTMAAMYGIDGMTPTVTPDHRSAWTSIAGNAENTANQTTSISLSDSESLEWKNKPGIDDATSNYGTILYADGYAFVKYGFSDASDNASLVCYDTETWSVVWNFEYPSASFETTTALIAGQYIFVQSTEGHIYRFDWSVGPGDDNCNVISLNNSAWDSDITIPDDTGATLAHMSYGDSLTSMVFDSGCIFVKSHNGMIYCFDTNLYLVWSYQTNGGAYYSPPTVYNDYVGAGMYDGHLYILDKHDGGLIINETVHEEDYSYTSSGTLITTTIGNVNVPIFAEYNGKMTLFMTYDDGRGMNTMNYGVAIYTFDGTSITEVKNYDQDLMGSVGKQLCLSYSYDMPTVFVASGNGMYKIDANGNYELISDAVSGSNTSHSFPVLVNEKYLFISTYSSHKIIAMDTSGNTLYVSTVPISNYCMASVTVCDGLIMSGNDSGAYAFSSLDTYTPPVTDSPTPLWKTIVILMAALCIIVSALWAILKFGLKWERPFTHIRDCVGHYFYGDEYSHNTKSKRRLWIVLLLGISVTVIISILSLCIGSETTLSVSDALSALISSVQKGGQSLTYNEMLIYNSRLPRTVAALCVGIGLSVAGAVYQAIVKNPLVEPYIMGVSSGAGTLAIAVMVFDFTFFGLFPSNDPYLTVFAAIVGGLLAFGLTMFLAEKTGGKSINYVLGGIVIGLVFSAVQSIMMVMAGNDISSALSWLYGSFASITWEKVLVMIFPIVILSVIPLIWSKELNLVLLGEDQAKQMGLNAHRFDSLMLIAASVLTAFCVAFCGIIGFVGLVIPHLCRMILGGDHRMMLPACIAFGGFLMIAADLLSRILMAGYELPVGAITTVIGVPVFAYLLIKRGGSYEM